MTKKGVESFVKPQSFSDILQAIKEKTEAGESCQMEFDQEGLKMILENLVPSLEFKKGLITLKPNLTQPPEVNISQKQGRIKLPLKINAGILGQPQVTLSLTLDEQLNYVSVSFPTRRNIWSKFISNHPRNTSSFLSKRSSPKTVSSTKSWN